MALSLTLRFDEILKVGESFIAVSRHKSMNSSQIIVRVQAPKDVKIIRTKTFLPHVEKEEKKKE